MKSVQLALCVLVFSPTLTAYAHNEIVPAGSLINCTISEPKLSSKTAAVGDPVLCSASITTRNGNARLPFNSYLEGRFEDYKDPGHFVGKGWMELKFDRMVVEPDTIIPISARVVDVPGYYVDQLGRIQGKGHRTRDIVEWMIPILWPIDLLNLPRRGPRPTLKTETRLTLKVMDDAEVPLTDGPERDPSGLYRREPSAYEDAPAPRPQDQVAQDEPQQPSYQPPPPAYQQQQAYQPPPQQYAPPQQFAPQQQSYAPAAPAPVYVQVVPMYMAPAPTVYVYATPPPPPVRVYMYSQPPVAMYMQPRVAFYPNTVAAYRPFVRYGYGY
jgi:hypothetical protein